MSYFINYEYRCGQKTFHMQAGPYFSNDEVNKNIEEIQKLDCATVQQVISERLEYRKLVP